MLKVKTYLDKSPINGIGLFSNQDISKGDIIWNYDGMIDQSYSKRDVLNMKDKSLKDFLKKYAYLDNSIGQGFYILCVDDARFMNHSTEPNTINGEGHATIASRDIIAGEELTCDYYEIDDDAKTKLSPKIITECIHDGSISRPLVKIKGKWLCGYCNDN